ncbi:MAG: helix-turn-helix transcriptional regulator [Solirubrobacteraceae bacterium]
MDTQPPGFRGRGNERALLDRLLDSARRDRGAVLVIRGEPGMGKTALLRHCVRQAAGFRVLECVGIESEMELPFAGLHQLCGPLLANLVDVPAPQRDALSVAFGLSSGDPPDRFLLALALLSLLSAAGDQRPLLCVVDDAQWLDRASAQALGFVARRLHLEPVALVSAVREPSQERELLGLPELRLGGLADEDARALLATVIPGPLDESVRDQLVAETRGNPLALLELPRGLTAAELAGGFALPDAGGLPAHLEDHYVRRLRKLPEPTQRLMLLAAADPLGDATLIRRAAATAGVGAAALTLAEGEQLLEIRARVRFRHPLVRSAVYRAFDGADRRGAHAALADATDAEADPDRRAWHRAHATVGFDADVAEELMRSAKAAERRGGIAAAAAFMERAVALTPEASLRGSRALAAAQAKFAAGDLEATQTLLAIADVGPLGELAQAQVQRVRAEIEFDLRRGRDAPPLLLRVAQRLEALDAELARETYLEALVAAIYAARFASGADVADVARAALSAPLGADPLPAKQLLLLGLATRLTDGYAAAAPMLKQALRARREPSEALDWSCWSYDIAAMDLWDDAAWFELASEQARLARATGTLSQLRYALDYLAGYRIQAGELSVAAQLVAEAERLDEGIREPTLPYISLLLAAWRGDAHAATDLTALMVRDASVRGEGCAVTHTEYAGAILNNGLGRYDAAADAAAGATAVDDLATSSWALYELVEAAARGGRRQLACTAVERLSERTGASGTEWAQGIEARSRALVAVGRAAEDLHREGLERLHRCRMGAHLARAQLTYGEWLRRENRRVDAREQLRRAHEALVAMGARGFAERARRELMATGEKVRRRVEETRDELTPQEGQIARLASEGLTNPEIGAQLFISPRTVEWHLRKVFTKLGISSRKSLPDVLPGAGTAISA